MTLIKEEKQDHKDMVRVEKWKKQMHKQKQGIMHDMKNNEWLIIDWIGV